MEDSLEASWKLNPTFERIQISSHIGTPCPWEIYILPLLLLLLLLFLLSIFMLHDYLIYIVKSPIILNLVS